MKTKQLSQVHIHGPRHISDSSVVPASVSDVSAALAGALDMQQQREEDREEKYEAASVLLAFMHATV